MNNAIKDYIKFNVLGLDMDVSMEDNKRLNELSALNTHYEKYADIPFKDYYVIEMNYNLNTQARIFNYKDRTGKNLTFKNSSNVLCFIEEAKTTKNTVQLKCRFYYNKNKYFYLSLSRFLELYANKEFHDVCPKKFAETYLKTAEQCLNEVTIDFNEIKDKYNKLYKSKEKELKQGYLGEINKYSKLEKEAKSTRKEYTGDKALKIAKQYKGVQKTKNYWTSLLTKEEQEKVMSWIKENIYSIRVYGLSDGQSGKVLEENYNNIPGIKYRAPEYNAEGKLTSQDSIVAHLSFKNIDTAPKALLEKITSNKRTGNLFYHNRLNDKNLALYLLSEYSDEGFEAGVPKLNKKLK